MGTKSPGISEIDVKEVRHATPPKEPIPPTNRPKRRSFAFLWLILLAGLAYAGFHFYQADQQKQKATQAAQAARAANRSVPVVTDTVKKGDIPVYLRGLGTVTPFNTVAVKSRVDGQLIAIHFTEGQVVNKGDLIAEIDPRPFQVQLEQAEGQLAKDQAALKDAQVDQDRYQQLWKEGVIAKQQLDTQVAQVGQDEGSIKADQANIDNAKLQLVYAKITAPLTGRIGLRQVDVGNIIHATDANGLAVIDQMQPIAVLFTIPADNLQPVLKQLNAHLSPRVDAYDRDDRNKISSGKLLTVDNQIDPTTGTSRMKAVFDNTDGALFPNQFVNCRLLLDVKRGVTLVSAPAIQRGPQGMFVYLLKPDNTVSVRAITEGITEGDSVEITSGLQPGDIVVTEGQDKLQDGTKVNGRANGAGQGKRGKNGNASAPATPAGNQTTLPGGDYSPGPGGAAGAPRGNNYNPAQGNTPSGQGVVNTAPQGPAPGDNVTPSPDRPNPSGQGRKHGGQRQAE